jgi:hypothetical protein
MGVCWDQSTTFLKRIGYNVVRHPRAGIEPLQIIGIQRGEAVYQGSLAELVREPGPDNHPNIDRDIDAADINGQRSSDLKLGVGLNILKGVLAAFGADVGIDAAYQQARTVTFEYTGVKNDLVGAFSIGKFLRDAVIDSDNPVLQEYVLGNGKLYIIVKTAKTTRLTVDAKRSGGASVAIDAPLVQQAVGAKVEVEASATSQGTLTYTGSSQLVFGFQCLELGFVNGEITPINVAASTVAMHDGDEPPGVVLDPDGLFDLPEML